MSNEDKYKQGNKIPEIKVTMYEQMFTKLVEKPNQNQGDKDFDNYSIMQAMPISNYSRTIIQKNKEIIELFPDLELAIGINKSSIISPNTMEDEPNRIRLRRNSGVPTLVSSAVANIVENSTSNKINHNKILEKAKYKEGAWIQAIIPESTLDDFMQENTYGNESDIDTSNMNKKKNKIEGLIFGRRRNSKTVLKEAFENDLDLKYSVDDGAKIDTGIAELEKILKLDNSLITDDFSLLKGVSVALEDANKTIKNKLKILRKGATSNKKITDEEIKQVFSKINKTRDEFVAINAGGSNTNKSGFLEIDIPVSSCVPVFPSGKPDQHIGYFILINPNTGTPISDDDCRSSLDSYNRMYANGINNELSGGYVGNVMNSLKTNQMKSEPKIEDLDNLYNKLLDYKIKTTLKESTYGDAASLDITTNEIYRVMLSRILEAKQTRLLFLPAEMVSYIAFDYRSNGTGKSLLENLDFFINARAIIMFTNLMAQIQNSMSNTRVNAIIDPNHPNPKKMKEIIISEVINGRGAIYPFNIYRHNELAEWAKYMGLQFNVKHPKLGDTEITFEDVSKEKKEINPELEEKMTSYIYYAIGVTKEQIDSASMGDFAIAVATRSKIMGNRIKTDQDIYTPQISELIKRKTRYNNVDYSQIQEVVEKNYSSLKTYLENLYGEKSATEILKNKEGAIEILTECLIDDIEFFLPEPEVTEDNTKMEQFDKFTTALDNVLGKVVSDDTITETTFGELNMNKEDIVKMIKFSATIDYLKSNKTLRYLSDMLSTDTDDKALKNPIEEYYLYTKIIGDSMLAAKEKGIKEIIDINKRNAKLDEKLNETEEEIPVGNGIDDMDGNPASDETNSEDLGNSNPIDENTGGEDVANNPIDIEPAKEEENNGEEEL